MAANNAYETMVKHWAAILESLRPLVHRMRNWTVAMRHNALWLLASPTQVAASQQVKRPFPTISTYQRPSVVRW